MTPDGAGNPGAPPAVIPKAALFGEPCEGAGQTTEPQMPIDPAGTTRPAVWIGLRVAHPARDLARSTAFYRDLLALGARGGFTGHDGYDGVFFALPGGGELELTAGPVGPAAGTEEDLLVLYVRTIDEVAGDRSGLWPPPASPAWTPATRTGIVVGEHFWTPTGIGS